MVFGGVNTTQIDGDLKEFKLVNNKWWALHSSEFRYANIKFNQRSKGPESDKDEGS